jgi:hypothetical protein
MSRPLRLSGLFLPAVTAEKSILPLHHSAVTRRRGRTWWCGPLEIFAPCCLYSFAGASGMNEVVWVGVDR